MKWKTLLLVVGCLVCSVHLALAVDPDPCATPSPAPKDALAGLRSAAANDVPELVPTTKILPAGASTELVVQKEFDPQTVYRAIVDGTTTVLLHDSQIGAKRIPSDYPLVKTSVVTAASTLLTLNVPSTLGAAWSDASIYVYGCKTGQSGPIFVSSTAMPVSYGLYSSAVVWAFLIIVYALIASAARLSDPQRLRWIRYLDPVLLTEGPNGKGNLAKLQILFFSMIVVGLVAYIVSRTGILSDLSSTILILLGIAGVGSAAAKATDVSRNRLDFDNWAWFIRKGWLPQGGLAAVNNARWRDIVTTDGEFDVYHFQNLIFSVVVGGALLVVGLRDLASFTIPETLLGILGLSQVVYIGGKVVAPPNFAELNSATTKLRDLEKDFVTTAARTPDPAPPPGVNPNAPPPDLQAAIRRAGPAKYDAYMDCAQTVQIMFRSVIGQDVTKDRTQPAFSY